MTEHENPYENVTVASFVLYFSLLLTLQSTLTVFQNLDAFNSIQTDFHELTPVEGFHLCDLRKVLTRIGPFSKPCE